MSEEVGFIDADCRDFECVGRFFLQSNTARIMAITFCEKRLKFFSGPTIVAALIIGVAGPVKDGEKGVGVVPVDAVETDENAVVAGAEVDDGILAEGERSEVAIVTCIAECQGAAIEVDGGVGVDSVGGVGGEGAVVDGGGAGEAGVVTAEDLGAGANGAKLLLRQINK